MTGNGLLRPTTKVLPADARRANRSLVLQHLFRSGPASRADLARASGLTRMTVGELVVDLAASGHVVEVRTDRTVRAGKPATLLALADEITAATGVVAHAVDDADAAAAELGVS